MPARRLCERTIRYLTRPNRNAQKMAVLRAEYPAIGKPGANSETNGHGKTLHTSLPSIYACFPVESELGPS